MEAPETKYTRLGGSCIAYQVLGDGPLDIVYVAGMVGNIDVVWEFPPAAHFFGRLASFSRLILFDRRGAGASDPLPFDALPTWEEWSQDLRVVLDTVGSKRVAIIAVRDAGPWGMLFAATHPQRTSALILGNTTASYVSRDDCPGVPREAAEAFARTFEESWGTDTFARSIGLPSSADDESAMRWTAKLMRASTSPRAAAAQFRYLFDIDARAVLPMIRVPTLVVHKDEYALVPSAAGKYVAAHIPGARYVGVPGRDPGFFTEQSDDVLDVIEEFLTGARRSADTDRLLATVLFTDIVGSTDRVAALGDRRWKQRLDAHDEIGRERIESFGGRVVKTTGDGVLAVFDGPGRAIRCALEMRAALRRIGIEIRAGLHAGEVELRGDDVGGIAVHIGARVMHAAGPGEVACTRTVKDLVAGSEFSFEDRGCHVLKGVPEEWQLFTVGRPRAKILDDELAAGSPALTTR